MALLRKLFYRKPPDGLLEISERVYVFDCCFTTDAWAEDSYKGYVGGVVSQLRDHYPDASLLVFNFREEHTASQIASALSDYNLTIMDYPRQYEGCPILPMEVIHHFLRSSESWLSLGHQNVLLMHCERGGWPVLAFMLAALLIYRKQYSGELKTLEMVYKQAPRELLYLLSPLNPIPSQARYLQYVSRRNLISEWPPSDRALTLDCIIIRMIPNFDGEGGCRPIFRIYGQDPFLISDRTPKMLFSTPKWSKTVRHYKQVECELVKIDINCHVQGDVVLECISLYDDMEREQMMFRVMFNTSFIRSNILMLNRDEIDILWDAKDQFLRDFRAEVLFSEMDAAASVIPVDLSCFEEKDGLPVEAFAKVNEMFSSVDWILPKTDAALSIIQQMAVSNVVKEKLGIDALSIMEASSSMKKGTAEKRQNEATSLMDKSNTSSIYLSRKEQAGISPVLPVNAYTDEAKSGHEFLETRRAVNEKRMTPFPISEFSSRVTAEIWNDKSPPASNLPPYHVSQDFPSHPSVKEEPNLCSEEISNNKAVSSFPAIEVQPVKSIASVNPIPHALPVKDSLVDSRPPSSPIPPSPLSSLSNETASRSEVPTTPPPIQQSSPIIGTSSDAKKIAAPSSSPLHPISVIEEKNDAAKTIESPVHPHPPPRLASPGTDSSTDSKPVGTDSSTDSKPVGTDSSTDSKPLGTVSSSNSFSPSSAPPTFSIAVKSDDVERFGTSPAAGKSGPQVPPSPPPRTSISSLSSVATYPAIKTKPSPPPPPPPPPFKETSPSEDGQPSRLPPTQTLKESTSLRGGSVPPPPPPPPPPTLALKENSASRAGSSSPPTTPPPPPPPPFKEDLASGVGQHPPPPPAAPPLMDNSTSRAGPPPPPPPIHPFEGNSASRAGTPPPPPPPLFSGPAAVAKTSSVVPSAPPPPTVPSAPPPPPPGGNLTPGAGPTHSVPTVSGGGSNPPGTPSPPPPSIPPPGAKGKPLLSRTITSKNSQTKKLKPLHWLKITRAVQGSLWAETQKSGEASKAPEIDISELESLFSAASADPGGAARKSKSGAALGQKPEKVQLVDHRRAYNCEIMLSKVKIPLPDLLSSVLSLEESSIDVDQVENLIKFCPTKEEMELLKGYKGEREKLGRCEQFFLELIQVPRIEHKLRVFSFKIQFRAQVSELGNNLNVVNSAADQIRNSAKLKRIMQTILSLGNALNQGTARGSAVGFRLDSLLKLTETRARNTKMTLMHYLCKVLADKLPELVDFSKDLSSLERASKIQLKFLAEEMQAVSKGLEKVVQELSVSESDGPVSEHFRKALKEFLCFAEGEVRSLASLYSTVGRNVDALILYFGEDPSKCPYEQVISTILNFVRMFNQAHEENCKQLEFERKKAEKEAAAEMKMNSAEKLLRVGHAH